jgi:hypothetical protein
MFNYFYWEGIMLRKMILFLLVIGFGGCGGGNENALELQSYVDKVKNLDGLNQKIANEITRLNEPSIEITSADLEKARAMLADYLTEMEKIVELNNNQLRLSNDKYVREIKTATELAADSGRELKNERGNVLIGMKHLQKMTRQHYNAAIDLLWGREKIESEMPLKWPN